MESTPIILDCDPGHDDAVAILLAVASPKIELLAVTTVFGNCSVEDATRNAQRILTLAGALSIPVAQGASRALLGDETLGNYVHGKSGLDGSDLPEPGQRLSSLNAVDLMVSILERTNELVTIVATGPITNVATLLRDHPDVKEKIREIIFMGGSTERGNHTPSAEFNTFADPEALEIVLKSGLRIRMVGLNLTHQALATEAVVSRMIAMRTKVGTACAEWMGFFGSSYRAVWSFESPPVHDPCTVAVLIDETLITWKDSYVAVELVGKYSRGATIVDLDSRYSLTPNCQVAMHLETQNFWDLVITEVGRLN